MKGIINVGSVTSNLSSNLNHLTLTHEMFRERIIKMAVSHSTMDLHSQKPASS